MGTLETVFVWWTGINVVASKLEMLTIKIVKLRKTNNVEMLNFFFFFLWLNKISDFLMRIKIIASPVFTGRRWLFAIDIINGDNKRYVPTSEYWNILIFIYIIFYYVTAQTNFITFFFFTIDESVLSIHMTQYVNLSYIKMMTSLQCIFYGIFIKCWKFQNM